MPVLAAPLQSLIWTETLFHSAMAIIATIAFLPGQRTQISTLTWLILSWVGWALTLCDLVATNYFAIHQRDTRRHSSRRQHREVLATVNFPAGSPFSTSTGSLYTHSKEVIKTLCFQCVLVTITTGVYAYYHDVSNMHSFDNVDIHTFVVRVMYFMGIPMIGIMSSLMAFFACTDRLIEQAGCCTPHVYE